MGRKRKIEEVEDIKNEDVETVDTPVVEQAIELAVEAEKVEENIKIVAYFVPNGYSAV